MFGPFLKAYPPEEIADAQMAAPRNPWPGGRVAAFAELTTGYTRVAFGRGIYRLHSQESSHACDRLIRASFPWLDPTVYCFGYDWLGRQFAFDGQRMAGGEPLVLMCDLTTREAFNIPAVFTDFHNITLIEKCDAALEAYLFARCAVANRDALPLRPHQIVGYRIPLSLGGKHDLENFDVVDFDVEIHLTGQIDAQVHAVPEGTQISGVESDDE